MPELVLVLMSILEEYQRNTGGQLFFPQFFPANEVDLSGHQKQESEIPHVDCEWVSQSGGMSGDDFSGTIIFIYGNLAIKTSFYC